MAIDRLTVDPLFTGIYKDQLKFQTRLLDGFDPENLTPFKKMEYLREQSLALTDELHEALAETGWKSWATSNHINSEAYRSELADVFIFFMNLMLVDGCTPEELMAIVAKKIAKNHKRQDDGYDGVSTKCPGCKRAYDDDAVKCKKAPPFPNGQTSDIFGWCDAENRYVNEQGQTVR